MHFMMKLEIKLIFSTRSLKVFYRQNGQKYIGKYVDVLKNKLNIQSTVIKITSGLVMS